MLKQINPSSVAASPILSQGVEASGFQRVLFVSGQVGALPDGSVPDGISEQTEAAIANLNAVLAEADMSSSDIAKLTIFLTDESNLGGFMEAAGGSLPMPPPATTLIFARALASPALLVEIEAIAVK